MKWLLAVSLFCMISCNQQNKSTNSNTDKSEEKIADVLKISPTEAPVININLRADNLPKNIICTILNNNQKINIRLNNVQTEVLSANIKTNDSDRNIRFNQIIMPDNTADGPFGEKMEYQTKQKGTYTLIIGKDNMADGKYIGELSISIHLKN